MFLEGVRHRKQVIIETGKDKETECNYPGKQSLKLLLFGFLTSGFHCSCFAFPYWSLFLSPSSSKRESLVCINQMNLYCKRSCRKAASMSDYQNSNWNVWIHIQFLKSFCVSKLLWAQCGSWASSIFPECVIYLFIYLYWVFLGSGHRLRLILPGFVLHTLTDLITVL